MKEDDGHCTAHEQNTTDLAAIKASNKLLAIMLPVIIAIASGITGYYVNRMDDTMDKLAKSIAVIHEKVDSVNVSTQINNQKLAGLYDMAQRKR